MRVLAATSSQSLAKWFAGSRVTTSSGKPLPVYHAARTDIHQFAFRPREFKRVDFQQTEPNKWNVIGTRYNGSRARVAELWGAKGAQQRVWLLHQFGQLERLMVESEQEAMRESALMINPPMPVSERIASGFRVFFFAEDPKYASTFSTWYGDDKPDADNQGVIYPCYLKIVNPMLPLEKHWQRMRAFYARACRGHGQTALLERCRTLFLNGRWEVKEAYPGFVEAAKRAGFDGFFSYEGSSSAFRQMDSDGRDPAMVRVWAVFYNHQIKSAISSEYTSKPGLTASI